ncbi:hypothetical protein LV478_13620 [Komagataeibacter oboediens]|uniref:hypothetical protein n=1 Tax=Komagataeibacter oboediens TaxID=65958 RepID=UPI0023D99FD0|nr:hypothetical protein [Komagataeibacter oboediens]WEQ51549.1 hypothetical protein LV478_13620 [Komagataeibacter oboediens]
MTSRPARRGGFLPDVAGHRGRTSPTMRRCACHWSMSGRVMARGAGRHVTGFTRAAGYLRGATEYPGWLSLRLRAACMCLVGFRRQGAGMHCAIE